MNNAGYGRQSILLNGSDWLVNFYPQEYKVRENEFNLTTLCYSTGFADKVYEYEFEPAGWMKGMVPGDVRQVLIENGQLLDPFYARNSFGSAWVTQQNWWYRKEFVIPKNWKGRHIKLVFEGVDYEATYWFNGHEIGSSKDMFRRQVFTVTDLVKYGDKNVLVVLLHNVPDSTCNHFFDGTIPERSRHHKAQMSWGWDWARPIVSMGIWDDVYLVSTKSVYIQDVFVQTTIMDNYSKAEVSVAVEVINYEQHPIKSTLALLIKGKNFDDEKQFDLEKAVVLTPGRNNIQLNVEVDSLRLWWPNGHGEQPLYVADLCVKGDDSTLDDYSVTFGIRELKMLKNPGLDDDSYDLTFCVNGKKIFAKGACWVPADMFFGRTATEVYRHLLTLARNANFTMLRVWGGGLIEKDEFYDICDELGIMVWQEFPLSCSNYPKDDKFVEEKRAECEDVVRRLRNHVSLSLWCGGNEIFYYGETPESPVLTMFDEMIRKLHPGIDYHYSSPDKTRVGEADHGPWTYQGHSYYNEYFRHFVSEVGCAAMPDVESLRLFIPEDEMWPMGPSYAHHFANRDGTFDEYVKPFEPTTLQEYVFASQLVQADELSYVMEACRRRKWENSGCLYWQYNVSWPAAAWEIVDWYGRPKAAYYWIKKACEPINISVKDDGWILEKYIINGEIYVDNETDADFQECVINATLYNAKGEIVGCVRKEGIPVLRGDIRRICGISFEIAEEHGKIFFLRVQLFHEKKLLASSTRYYFVRGFASALHGLYPVNLECKVLSSSTVKKSSLNYVTWNVSITNTSDVVSFFTKLAVDSPPMQTYLDDNYFVLLPKEQKTVFVEIACSDRAVIDREVSMSVTGWNVCPTDLCLSLA